jgi:hypothetical protein
MSFRTVWIPIEKRSFFSRPLADIALPEAAPTLVVTKRRVAVLGHLAAIL